MFSPPAQDGVEHLVALLSPVLTIPSMKRETEAETGSDSFHLLAHNGSNILSIFSLGFTKCFPKIMCNAVCCP